MGLTNKKEEQLKKMPIVENKVFMSKNKRFLVHQTRITNIKPVAYYEKILAKEDDLVFQEDNGLQEVVL